MALKGDKGMDAAPICPGTLPSLLSSTSRGDWELRPMVGSTTNP